ncbi:MAG: tripartite tricarboxylate transporter substrate binding protein [Piscinibacter sp.]|nr:tripartite tricarboxylate transporter substrate binding protein [Piscinibacter sp.]
MLNRRQYAALAAAGFIHPLIRAAAPAWPSRPLKILVGFPGGSTPDMAARTLAEPLSAVLGVPVVIDNKAGASGNLAAAQVAQADDDHTLGVLINGNLTSAKMLSSKLPYDPDRDFTLLSLLTTAPLVLVAPASLPAGAAFFAEARAKGTAWSYGSVGIGSVGHLGVELLKTRMPGLAAVHVPYRGNPPVVTALLSGEIQFALVPPGLALPHVRSGKLQAIGLTSGRSALAPEVMPLADAGVRDFTLEVWTGLVGPARLSQAARARLAKEVPEIIRSPAVRQQLLAQGWQAAGTSPEGMAIRVREETKIMQKIIAATGTKLD